MGQIADWPCPTAVMCLLALNGCVSPRLHEGLTAPSLDSTTPTVAKVPEETIQDVDGLRKGLAYLAKKVDWLLVDLARAK